jgi:hypothetical protein
LWKQNNLIVWLYGCCRMALFAVDAATPPSPAAFDAKFATIADACNNDPLRWQAAIAACFGTGASVSRVVAEITTFRNQLFGHLASSLAGYRVPLVLWESGSIPPLVGDVRVALAHYTTVVVDEFSEELTTMAPELAAGPPEDFHRAVEGVAAAAGGQVGGLPGLQDLDVRHGNPLMLLLQSLLPWNMVQPQGEHVDRGELAAAFNEGDFVWDSDEE